MKPPTANQTFSRVEATFGTGRQWYTFSPPFTQRGIYQRQGPEGWGISIAGPSPRQETTSASSVREEAPCISQMAGNSTPRAVKSLL